MATVAAEPLAPTPEIPPSAFESGEPTYDLAHGSVEVPNAREPVEYTIGVPRGNLRDLRIHLFIPGFGGFKRSSRKVRNALAENEQTVGLSYEPSRHGGTKNDLLDAQKIHYDTVTAIIQDLPDNPELNDTANGPKIDLNEVVLTPHSMGGIPATEYALNHSENVAQIINIAIVGTEAAVMWGFLSRVKQSATDEFWAAAKEGEFGSVIDAAIMGVRALRYYGVNPLRTIGEVKSCFEADQRPKLAAIGAIGIKTALYLPADDRLIPAESNAKAAAELVDYMEIAEGLNHLAPQIRPARMAADLSRISNHLSSLS